MVRRKTTHRRYRRPESQHSNSEEVENLEDSNNEEASVEGNHSVVITQPNKPDVCQNSDKSKVSTAPLHSAYRSRHAISRRILDSLRQAFVIHRGKWTQAETNRLIKNWNRLCRYHPNYADPKFVFSYGHDSGGKMSSEEIRWMKKEYGQFDIMERLAYKLDTRLICDVYSRGRVLFYFSSFRFRSRSQVPSTLMEKALRDLKAGESMLFIAHRYDISPQVLKTLKRRPRNKDRRYTWKYQAISDLKNSISYVEGENDSSMRDPRDINWSMIVKQMKLLGYNLDEEQCYHKWRRMYIKRAK